MLVENDEVVEISEADTKKMKVGIEVNEWGLSRNICNFYTQPPFLNNINTRGIAEQVIYKPKEKKKKKKLTEKESSNSDTPVTASSLCNGFEGGNQWCPPAWDGLLCWPATPAGNLISLSCPEYFQGFNPLNKATRRCMEDGTWYFNYERNSTWTNYSECFTEKISPHHQILFKYVPIIKAVSQVGYSVSLITLIVAFCIFATFKGLRCPRNKLHMHLFLSFMLRAFSTLFKDLETSRLARQTSTRDGVQVKFRNDWESCRAVTSLWQYFLLANYSWILMEGLYLHNLIFLALFSDTSSIALYVVLGWGLPLIFIVPWIIARIIWENTLCWSINDNPYISLLIKGPTTLSVLLNFVLFIKIVRVLLMKLQASVNEQNRRFRRWAKSTLVLVPLFGVHYALFIGMPYVECGPEVEAAWLFGDQLFASFQGFFVALLYCFMNGEVRAELNKKCRRWWARRHGSPPAFRRPSNPMHSVTSTSYIRGGKFNHKGYRDKRKSMGRLETSVTSVTCSSLPGDTARKSLPTNCLHNNVNDAANWSNDGICVNSRLTGNGIELVPLKERYEL